MKRIIIVFSMFAVLLSLGISIGAPKLVHMQDMFIGENNPKNQKWLTTDDKKSIALNILCKLNVNPPDKSIPKFRICTVKYLTSSDDRKPFLLTYKREDKKFYLGDEKEPYNSGEATESAIARGKYAKYGNMEATKRKWGAWPAIWVMDQTGRLYVSSTPQAGIFNHSSFLAGGSVICAGEIHIVDGVIKRINNGSGHYKPPDKALQNAVDELLRQGVKLDDDLQIEEQRSGTCTRFDARGKDDSYGGDYIKQCD